MIAFIFLANCYDMIIAITIAVYTYVYEWLLIQIAAAYYCRPVSDAVVVAMSGIYRVARNNCLYRKKWNVQRALPIITMIIIL